MELLEFKEKIDLPENWKWTTIDQILESIESGGRPKGGVKGILEGVPSIGGEHLKYSGGFDFSNIRYIPKVYFEKLSKGKINNSDVLVVKDGATTGKTSFVSESFPYIDAAVNEHVFILRTDKNKVQPKFLFYWMQSQFGQNCVAANFKGTAQGGITTSFAKNSPFPLVPLRDQFTIIDKIEELFTQLDAAEAALKRAKINLKRYKQSLLQAAVTGELTKEWREAHKDELEPASNLLEKIKTERKAKWEAEIRAKGKDPANEEYKEPKPLKVSDFPKLPDGWCWVDTEFIIEFLQYGTSEKANSNSSGIPVLRMGNIQDGNLSFVSLKYLPKDTKNIEKYFLQPGDVLFNRTNSAELVGKTAVFSNIHPKSTFASYLIRVRTINYYSPDLFANYTNSIIGKTYINSVISQQVGQANVNGQKLKRMPIPLLPENEQKIIIDTINEKFYQIEMIDKYLEKNLHRINLSRQAILQKAFTGKLIPPQTEEIE